MSDVGYSGQVIFGHRLKVGEEIPDLKSLTVTNIDENGVYTWGGLYEDSDLLPVDWEEMNTNSLFISTNDTGKSKLYEKTSQTWYDI